MKITKLAKPGEIMPQPPKDPNSGKMDSQIFIGKEDPQKACRKKKQVKKKKKASVIEARMGFPLETHDERGFWDKRKRGELGDLELIESIQIVKNANWAGVERDEIKNDLDTALQVFDMDRNVESACRMIEDALRLDSRLDEIEKEVAASFNLKRHYRKGE